MDPYTLVINASGSSPASFGTFPQGNSVIPFLIFIVIIVSLRLYRGLYGRIYSNVRVLRLPVVYTAFTLLAVIGFGFLDNLVFLTLVLIPVGFLIGYRFTTGVNFFTRNGVVYYKREPVIMTAWLISFVGRMILEVAFPYNLQINVIVDAILSFTTGLIIGEAFNILSERKKYVPEAQENHTDSDNFRINM